MELVLLSCLLVLIFIALGMPVLFCFLVGSLFFFILSGESMGSVVRDAFFSLNKYALLAVPLFMIAGKLMEISEIASRLIDFSRALLKKFKGGMGAIIPVASMFFGALTGSQTATVAALSTILIPRLSKMGWDKRYTAALLAAAGPLGFMIPPNSSAILYGVVANTSIAALFLATVVPGIIWGVLYIILNRILYTKWYQPAAAEVASTTPEINPHRNEQLLLEEDVGYFRDLYKTFVAAIPAFIMPIIIMGGIYGGYFSPTEAGAVACVYALLAGIFIFKTINFSNGYKAFVETGVTMGSFMIILPMVIIITRILVRNGVPQMITESLNSISTNPYILTLLIVLIFFIAGFFLDPGVLIFVLTPLLLPTAESIGMDPIQFGVILFVSIGVGALTPPFALNLFIASRVSGVPLYAMMKPLMPFLLFAAIPILLLVAYVPQLSLWLPNLVMGR